MGVKNNASYKDMYHFKDRYYATNSEELPSLNVDPKINTSIKENPYRSNVEIEKGEIILKPDYTALFNAKGKKHSQGGIDVNLEMNSFVFSDDPTLALNEKDHKLFELKKGGTFSRTKNTPAKVLKRNVDTKHYNTLIANMSDIYKDDISKKSSALMLEKYLETVGNIAYIQESKKDFPDGVPEVSQGTAPVYDTDLKNEIMQQKQYAKYGGKIRMQTGGMGPTQEGNVKMIGNKTYVYRNGRWQLEESTRQGIYSGVPLEAPVGTKPFGYVPGKTVIKTTAPPIEEEPLQPNDIPGTGQGYEKQADWQFTPWQKVGQAYNLSKLATAKRYMPYRSRYDASYVDPALVNPEQAIADTKGGFNQVLKANNSLSPILRNAQTSSAYGQFLDQAPSIRSQYDNQNVGIINQFRQYNNQNKNAETMTNMQNDQNYYREVVVGNQNFDNLKSFLGDKYMSDKMRDVEQNQSLAYNLLTQRNPAYSFDWRTGNFKSTGKDIRDVQSNSKSDLYTEVATSLAAKMKRGEKLTQEEIGYFKALSLGKIPFSQKKGGTFRPKK